jgi:hypothetical protein
MAQGILPFQYETDHASHQLTGLGGLPLYLDLAQVARLREMIDGQFSGLGPGRGWTASQHILAVILLNLAGGDCMDDLDVLDGDHGFGEILRQAEVYRLGRRQRRILQRRWRKERDRTVPAPSVLRRFLHQFHRVDQEELRQDGQAFIPAPNEMLRRLQGLHPRLISFFHSRLGGGDRATLDMDATLVETHKESARHCYKKFKSYQPLNTWWAELGMIVHTEFRDGNVPAGWQQLRVFQEALANLPESIEKVYLRSDSAGYQWDLLRYYAEGQDRRFGVIEFAVSCDVTPDFKRAVAEVAEEDWRPLWRTVDGHRQPTNQQWAEVCFVPSGAGFKKDGPGYRYLAIREVLPQLELPGLEAPELPFPVMSMANDRYKLTGVVTNRTLAAEELIWWSRERCGESEQAHAVMKNDLAGGRLPSGLFGANAA